MGLELRAGDTFLFSSKTIPGNEVAVGRIMNQLSAKGVRIVDDSAGLYHVSGHANRPDIEAMHDLLRPKVEGVAAVYDTLGATDRPAVPADPQLLEARLVGDVAALAVLTSPALAVGVAGVLEDLLGQHRERPEHVAEVEADRGDVDRHLPMARRLLSRGAPAEVIEAALVRFERGDARGRFAGHVA